MEDFGPPEDPKMSPDGPMFGSKTFQRKPVWRNENVENILENEQIKHYTDKIASNEYVEKYSKNFIKNAHTIKELGEEKFFNEENDLKEIDVILVDDKNKKV